MIAAARIQRMTRLFDAHIIAGEETFRAGRGPRPAPRAGPPRLKGIKQRAALYEILGSRRRGPRPDVQDLLRRHGGQATILIVDDEPRVLDALEAVLAAEFRMLRADQRRGGPRAARARKTWR